MPWVLVSTKSNGLEFTIVKLNKETMQAQLVGSTGVPFDKTLTPDVLSKYGYTIVRRDAQAA